MGPAAYPGEGGQGLAVAPGVVLLHGGEQAEIAGSGFEDPGVFLGFVDLLVEFRHGLGIAVPLGLGGELGVHHLELVGLTFDRQFQAARQEGVLGLLVQGIWVLHHQLGVQQPEVGKGVLGFLLGGLAEQPRQVAVAELLGQIGEKQVFAVGHALAAKGRLEVLQGAVVHRSCINCTKLRR